MVGWGFKKIITKTKLKMSYWFASSELFMLEAERTRVWAKERCNYIGKWYKELSNHWYHCLVSKKAHLRKTLGRSMDVCFESNYGDIK